MDSIIEIKNINAGYNKLPVLEDISLNVYTQDFIGIIGPNGGGKTTLVKVILKQIKPTSGAIQFYKNGEKTNRLNIGYLPQYNLIDKQFPISVLEVILSGLDEKKAFGKHYSFDDREKAHKIISRLELNGLESRPIGELSGGQLQRTLLGRAIISDPEVIILDEPNTYVDKHFEKELYNILSDVNQECAIIMISHELESIAKHAKNIAYVNHKLIYHNGCEISTDGIRKYFE